MVRYYFNPFKRIFSHVKEEDTAKRQMFMGPATEFAEFLTIEELWDVFHTLYRTKKCFGKFDLFAKFTPMRLYFTKLDDIDTKERVRVLSNLLMSKCSDVCPRCPLVQVCSGIRIPLMELEVLWDNIYFNRADQFKEEKGGNTISDYRRSTGV